MNSRQQLVVCIAIAAGGVGLCLLLLLLANHDAVVQPGKPEVAAVKTLPSGPRRLPVTGAAGFYVVINDDGSSYLEEAGGQRTQLADAGQSSLEERLTRKIMTRVEEIQKKSGVEQLVICDTGAVNVPKGAIITYIGSDKVVTHNPSEGSSTTYYVDGRIVFRDRTERQSKEPTTRNPNQ